MLMDYVEIFCNDLEEVQTMMPLLAHIIRGEFLLPIDEHEINLARDWDPDAEESEEEEEEP